MNRYLLDTNHLSKYLDGKQALEDRIKTALAAGDRLGVCLPVLCEYRAGIRGGRRYQRNLSRLQTALTMLRIWPADDDTTTQFATIFQEVRSQGRMLSQFDMLIAAIARQHGLTLLTADQDFQPVPELRIENWL